VLPSYHSNYYNFFIFNNPKDMARKSRSSRRNTSQKLVVSGTKLGSRRRSRSTGRQVGFTPVNTPRSGSAVANGLFRPTRNFQKEMGGAILNPGFPGRSARKRGSRGVTTSLPHVVASYIDPFDEEAGGCRYPDVFQGITDTTTQTYIASITTAPPTGTFTDLNMVSVVPNLGQALFMVTPDPSNILVQGVCGTSSTGILQGQPNTFFWPNGHAFTATNAVTNAFGPGTGIINIDNTIGNLQAFRANYNAARLVAGGVKLFSTSNFSTVSGTIHVAPVFVNFSNLTSGTFVPPGNSTVDATVSEITNGWQTALPSDLQTLSNLPGYCQFPLSSLEEDEIAGIFKRAGEEALLFKPTGMPWCIDDHASADLTVRSGVANTPDNYGHYNLIFFLDGILNSSGAPAAASTPVIEIEIRNHYEVQFNPGSIFKTATTFISGLTNPDAHKAAPNQPLLMAAADNTASAVPAVRCVDAAGVEELGFMEAVMATWKNAVSVATSVAGAVDVASTLLSALVL